MRTILLSVVSYFLEKSVEGGLMNKKKIVKTRYMILALKQIV